VTSLPPAVLALALLALAPSLATAQPAAAPVGPPVTQVDPCPELPPAQLPPAGSPTLLRCMQLVAHPVNETIVDGTTYQYHIKTPLPVPAEGRFPAYNEGAVLADFWNLWSKCSTSPTPTVCPASTWCFTSRNGRGSKSWISSRFRRRTS
jgi:hypothetical protein